MKPGVATKPQILSFPFLMWVVFVGCGATNCRWFRKTNAVILVQRVEAESVLLRISCCLNRLKEVMQPRPKSTKMTPHSVAHCLIRSDTALVLWIDYWVTAWLLVQAQHQPSVWQNSYFLLSCQTGYKETWNKQKGQKNTTDRRKMTTKTWKNLLKEIEKQAQRDFSNMPFSVGVFYSFVHVSVHEPDVV